MVKLRKKSIDTDATRQKDPAIKNCAIELLNDGFLYSQHYGFWLNALCNNISEKSAEIKHRLMINQFKKDYDSKLGRIIFRRPKELQTRLYDTLGELYNHDKETIDMITPPYLKNTYDLVDDFLKTLVMSVVLPAIYRQCDIWQEKKFTISKYSSFRYAFESENFNALLDVVLVYLRFNISNLTESNENKPKS